MILSIEQLLEQYADYKDPRHKIQALVKSGELIPLKRGLYESNPNAPRVALAASLYGPSYISFEWALSYYGFIPERVMVYTSATTGKRRKMEFKNAFGTYEYQDIPRAAFPHGYIRVDDPEYPFLLATPEKAICDELYILPPIRGKKAFQEYLFDGMRFDEDEFLDLDFEKLRFLASLYHRTNHTQLLALLDRMEAKKQ